MSVHKLPWLGDAACDDAATAGGKAANLSRLAHDYPVPPGFCVPAGAFAAEAAATPDSVPTLPAALAEGVHEAYAALGRLTAQPEPGVAVRSSAVDEDSAGASFAGQHDTYLNVVGAEAVTGAIARCWGSTRSEHALAYRRAQGLGESTSIAVLVQQLVAADASAVVFSANPITGSRDEVMINANFGLGETIVSGRVTPDTAIVRKHDLAVTSLDIGEKTYMSVPIAGGCEEIEVPAARRATAALGDRELAELARLAVDLEGAMGWPVDLECAFRDGTLYLLQCRPITTLPGPG